MGSGELVVVVEDDPLVRMNAVMLVEDGGFTVLEAASADEAIALLEAHPAVRIVFTDVDMPGSMDGIRLAHYIRERWPPVHLVVASGKSLVPARELPRGARFLPKPYMGTTLVDTMRELLG